MSDRGDYHERSNVSSGYQDAKSLSPWPHAESSIPTPCGNCWRCGGQLYEYLVHHCTTAVRVTTKPWQWTVRL